MTMPRGGIRRTAIAGIHPHAAAWRLLNPIGGPVGRRDSNGGRPMRSTKTPIDTEPVAPKVEPPERWRLLTVGDIMKRVIISVPMSATAREIEQVLTENEISGVAVRNAEEQIVGIVSWRDVMAYFAQSDDRDPRRPHDFFRYIDGDTLETQEYEVPLDEEATAEEFMNVDLLTVPVGAGIRDAAKLMTTHRVHRLLVAGADGRIVGLISTIDILDTLTA
jgi:CBS domain-containing protein